MCDSELQRISELRDYSKHLQSPKSYFRDDDTKFSDPRRRRFFLDIELDLQGLDVDAWTFVKGEALPRLQAKHPTRGWEQLFETLNEAKGYNYLVRIGCRDVKFIPRSTTKGVRTPDLRGLLASTKVLCEVKSINVSARELDRRTNGGVGTILAYLEEGFFNKLMSDINTAALQMRALDVDVETRRIVYLVVSFDDNLHEYAIEYQKQIEAYIASVGTPGVEVVLDIKPPFYSAM
ncbi:MAG: hypothetical protein WA884_10395 [Methyloceanibacter sp.]